jgi:hypothetical protein
MKPREREGPGPVRALAPRRKNNIGWVGYSLNPSLLIVEFGTFE